MAAQQTNWSHPILQELNLALPMRTDTSWALSHDQGTDSFIEKLRFTLGAGGDLIVELHDTPDSATRYVFDNAGNLVSMYHSQPNTFPLFQALRKEVLRTIRACYLDAY